MDAVILALMFVAVLIVALIVAVVFTNKGSSHNTQLATMHSDISESFGKLNAKIEDMDKVRKQDSETVQSIIRVMSGTKQRGNVGEVALKEVLSEYIKSKQVVMPLKVGSKEVEFGWSLGDGKYLPIDSKFPDVIGSYNEYCASKDVEEQKKLKKSIAKKVSDRKEEASKYLNKPNTIDKVLVVIPDAIYDLIPEINGDSDNTGIFVCGHNDVISTAILHSQYHRLMLEKSDSGYLQNALKQLQGMFRAVIKSTETIDRSLETARNANSEIKNQAMNSQSIGFASKPLPAD